MQASKEYHQLIDATALIGNFYMSSVLVSPNALSLQQLRGVGPMIATALVIALGDARQFANGLQFAASLGLTLW